MIPDTEATTLQVTQAQTAEPSGELGRLRRALNDAVSALARCGVTPAEYSGLPARERAREKWREAARVWEAAGIPVPRPQRVVLRCTRAGREEEREYDSLQAALHAAVAAVEMNEFYPRCIEVDGATAADRAAILRAWEERHDPG